MSLSAEFQTGTPWTAPPARRGPRTPPQVWKNEQHQTVGEHDGGVTCMAWHTSWRCLITCSVDGILKVWIPGAWHRCIQVLQCHHGTVTALAVHGEHVLTAGRDNKVCPRRPCLAARLQGWCCGCVLTRVAAVRPCSCDGPRPGGEGVSPRGARVYPSVVFTQGGQCGVPRVGGGGGHILPHPAQPQHTNHWAPRTRKRHQQEHRPQRPTESSDPTQHAKGTTGDCPGPRKETTTRRNVTQGAGGFWFLLAAYTAWQLQQYRCRVCRGEGQSCSACELA